MAGSAERRIVVGQNAAGDLDLKSGPECFSQISLDLSRPFRIPCLLHHSLFPVLFLFYPARCFLAPSLVPLLQQ